MKFPETLDISPPIVYNRAIKNREERKMLNTVEFGWIRVVAERPNTRLWVCLGLDLGAEWEFWCVEEGEIVAFWIGE